MFCFSVETKVPAISEIPLEDLAAVYVDLPNRKKFLSCVNQEILLRDEVFKKEVEEGEEEEEEEVKEEEEDFGHYFVKASMNLTSEKISEVSIFPSSSLNLLAAGDRSGAVTLWLGSDKDDLNVGRQFSFNPHASQINHLAFDPTNVNKLHSCSKDGYVRTTDLVTGKVCLTYDWAHFSEGGYAKAVSHFVPRSENELILSRWDETVVLYDIRAPKAVKVLVKGLNCFEGSEFTHHKVTPGYVFFHPTRDHMFSAPLENSLGFFDLRNEAQMVSELEATKPVLGQFSPSGESIFTVSFSGGKRIGSVYKVDADDNFSTEIVTTVDDYLAPKVWGEESARGALWMPWKQKAASPHDDEEEVLFAVAKGKTTANLIDKSQINTCLATVCGVTGEINATVDDALVNPSAGLAVNLESKLLVVFNSHDNGSLTLVKSS